MKVWSLVVSFAALCVLVGVVRTSFAQEKKTPAPPRNLTVWYKEGGFGGWPANNGAWSWGDEILVGFSAGTFKLTYTGHAIDNRQPSVASLGRTLAMTPFSSPWMAAPRTSST